MSRAVPNLSDETRTLSEYIAGAGSRALPDDVVEAAKHHIIDTLAAIVSGSRLHPGRVGAGYVSALGAGGATVIGTRVRASAADAAFANGMSAHADETDDSHFTSRTHPGAAIVPAAFAAAEMRQASGTGFLRAVVAGYDVGTRLVHALDMRGFAALQRSCHSYGGIFGAGAAAASIYRFDATHVRYLLTYCAQMASGCGAYMYDRSHVEKAFVYSGKPAQNGVTAAAMVAAGFQAADDVFSGERNFIDASAATGRREALVEKLGEHYEITRTNIKKWCVGSPIQAALDGLAALMQEHALKPADIRHVDIHLAPDQLRTVDGRPMPNVNIQHLAALLLTDGTLTFASSHDGARMQDAAVLALRQRVRLIPSGELAAAKPPRQTIVEIATDGGTVTRRVVNVRGTADNPMSRDEVVAKARDLMAPVLTARRCDDLIRHILDIEGVPDINALHGLLVSDAPR